MDFSENRPIYLQIADTIQENILSGGLKADDRIPSVREYGAEIGVNPNTVMRVYEILTAEGVIYNKRGIGYFVSADAGEKILAAKKAEFIERQVPVIKRHLKLLGLDSTIFND